VTLRHAFAALVIAGGLAGCGGAASDHPAPDRGAAAARSGTQTATRTDATPVRGDPIGPVQGAATLPAIRAAIASLDRDHPDVRGFAVQDVSYTARSRARVLGACAGTNRLPTAQVETARVLACAPLVFFYYEYGRRSSVAQAARLADTIYTYATVTIRGPLSARQMLDGVLHGWGLPLANASSPAPATASPAAAALTAAVRQAILARHTVRVETAAYRRGEQLPIETIAARLGTARAIETIREPDASMTVRVTPTAAYVAGDPAGLRTLLGLGRTAAQNAAGRWLRVARGSSQYQDLAGEDTLQALPASILPAGAADATLDPQRSAAPGRRTLRWSSTTAAGAEVRAALTVESGSDPLPISETTSIGSDRQTVHFSGWDKPLIVAAPH
jgi:hypothetical protein